MKGLGLRVWLFWRKLRFLLVPVGRRVRVELETDGRQLTFLLVSLHALGYAVHVVGSSIVFRDLLALRRSTQIPFSIGRPPRPCGLAICDTEAALARGQEPRKVLLSYDFFNLDLTAVKMPYFMHPKVYQNGWHHLPVPDPDSLRPVRIGFFGSRDADFYTRHFHFPMLDREQILTTFLDEFSDRIWTVDAQVASWGKHGIAVAIDGKGGDDGHKSFLPLPDYLQALRKCDFFLTPPGWCMPLSHNLIEGTTAGCIPILNCQKFMYPALEDGVNCLSFNDANSLVTALEAALVMSSENIETMRGNVVAYSEKHLTPEGWLDRALADHTGPRTILVNAEEISTGMRLQGCRQLMSGAFPS